MENCSSCGRHIFANGEPCPFCTSPTGGVSRRLKVIGASATAFVMAACYGIGPDYVKDTGFEDTGITNSEEGEDVDGDQVRANLDCNDLDPFVHPKAEEKCNDGIDNDCNSLIDAADPACK